jgi:uncharacterized membrane protein
MRTGLIAYLSTAAILVMLDLVWLKLAMGPLYQKTLGPLLAETPALLPAVIFYLMYAAGVVFFAVWPGLQGGDWRRAALYGAVLGLVAYGTYDLTNMATLKLWSARLTVLDIAWGTFLTATAAAAGTAVTLALEK